ncbi:potassium channel family protein [Billgrantia sp. Q4P2]|uniref:potassium channel family protein n=1 Tax=Billgrantia sp. Q4P2 TaxID=3463857 RepID=UPI0040569128
MFLLRLVRQIKAATLNLSWPVLFILVVFHSLTTWAAMALAGEEVSSRATLWLYYYVTTATTVGYGDYSPTTEMGQVIATFWFLPGSIMLFASFLGKAATFIAEQWRGAMCGKGSYEKLRGHTLIIGWHGETTAAMVDIILQDRQFPDEIVLCVTKDIENPLPGKVNFVRGESFSNPDLLSRAGVVGAKRVIIYDTSDERVATIALSVYRFKSDDCHVVAHCEDTSTAEMLRQALPGIECTQGFSMEMLVRSAMDRGISRVVNELLALNHGATQYQTRIPEIGSNAGVCYGDLLVAAKRHLNITLLGLCKDSGQGGDLLNPSIETPISSGDFLYYMGGGRISEADLSSLLLSCLANDSLPAKELA